MLELHVSSVDASNGNIPVSWCLSKDLIARLEKKNIKDPAVVISVVSQKYSGDETSRNKEARKVVRLKDLMTYIELPFAGACKIVAFVDDFRSFKEAKDTYMSLNRSGTRFAEEILDYNMEEYRYRDDICNAAPITLEVPNAIFAKEPSECEKTWVNWWSPSKAANQCDFRRKRMFAYTIQPLLFLAGYAMQIVFTMAAMLFGARALTFRPLLHPLSYNAEQKSAALFSEGSYFVANGTSFWDQVKYIPFMPGVILALLGLLTGGHMVSLIAMAILALLTIIAGIVGILCFYDKLKKLRELNAIPWYQDEAETALLLCTGENKPLTVAQLPSRHKTLGIRFQAFKAQVCRPFSQ